jgi:DNA-binding MltR family transcriptional regulator
MTILVLRLVLVAILVLASAHLIAFGVRAIVVSVFVQANRNDRRAVNELMMKSGFMFALAVIILFVAGELIRKL